MIGSRYLIHNTNWTWWPHDQTITDGTKQSARNLGGVGGRGGSPYNSAQKLLKYQKIDSETPKISKILPRNT